MPELWNRIFIRQAFCAAFVDRELVGNGVRFVIHSNGHMSGLADALPFSGQWHWINGFFCRNA